MVAAIVCEDVIAELNLVDKAVGNKKYAEHWLYVAIHMFASMRGTDCTRLVVPTLNIPADEALEQIRQGQFSEDMARSLVYAFMAQITALQMRPHKTEDKGLSPTLYINCPESCMPAFGRILAIVSAHQMIAQSSHNVVRAVNRNMIRSFFGPIFADACGNKGFSGRRANKALMQATSAEADASGLAPRMAYIIASRMRSHKGAYNELAQMTELYLRDSSFKSLTTEEIVYLLTERGVCSFIVDNILKMYCGEKYEHLSAKRQNQLIANVGMHPFVLDKAMRYTQLAMDQAVEVVQQCVKAQSAKDILAAIALGCATGKDQNTQCLCRAAQMRCQYPNRQGCLGCKYEIVTKALLMKLVQAYDTLWQENNETPPLEQQRNKWLANHVYAPAIAEVRAHLLDARAELGVYQQLVLEVSSNAGT